MKKSNKNVDHKEGEKSSVYSDAEWYLDINEHRWMLRCTKVKTYANGMQKRCDYHAREDRYLAEHSHGDNYSRKKSNSNEQGQQTLYDVGVDHADNHPFLAKIATIVAELNISANIMSSAAMFELFNDLIQFGYSLKEKKQKLERIYYSDKDINGKINELADSKYHDFLQKYKQFGIASAIVDAGTVRKRHTLEIILVNPGILHPFPYKSYKINTGDIKEYKNVFRQLFDDLYAENIVLTSICGDNLPAQRNGVDHIKPLSIQEEAFNTVIQITGEIEKDIAENKDPKIIAEKRKKHQYLVKLASILYIPCTNHVINLAFNDMLHEIDELHDLHLKLEKYNELFKNEVIRKKVGVLHFAIYPTRWMYLFEGLMYLFKNKNVLVDLYKLRGKDDKISEILNSQENDIINEYPKELVAMINILWPLHSFSYYLEQDDSLFCFLVPILDKVYKQIRSRCAEYHYEEVGERIIQKIENRFKNTGRLDLMKASFLLTPYGRKKSLPKDAIARKFQTFKPNIQFFSITDSCDNGITKFKQYLTKSKTAKDDDDNYYYFEDNINDDTILSSKEKAELINDTILDLKQLKNVSENTIQYIIDLYLEYKDKPGIDMKNDTSGIWRFMKSYFDDYYTLLTVNLQKSDHIAEISLYIENISMNPQTSTQIDSLIHQMKDFKVEIHNANIESDNLIDIINRNEYPIQKMKKHLENLDLYSDEIMVQIALFMQKHDSNTIWNSISLLETTSESSTCTYVINEMARILFPEIDSSVCVTPYLEEHLGTYSFDENVKMKLFSKFFLMYHSVLYWRRLIDAHKDLTYFAQIAIRLVSLPASEAGCERMFSRRRKIISSFHTRMSEKLAFSRAFLMSTKSV